MKLLIFDIDGTLTDTVGIDDYCFKKTFEDLYKIDWTRIDWQQSKQISGNTDSGMANEIIKTVNNRPPDNNETDKIKGHFMSLLMSEMSKTDSEIQEIPGADSIIWKMLSAGYAVAFATGSWRASGMLKLSTIGIDSGLFPYSNAENAMDRVSIIKDAISKAKFYYKIEEFESVTYIGDGLWDYQAALTLGINFVGISGLNNSILADAGAEKVIKNFDEYDKFLDYINSAG